MVAMSSARFPPDAAAAGQLPAGRHAAGTAWPDVCVHELFEQQVARTPAAVAVVFGERQLTYRQLNERANRVAHYLRRHGVGPEALVGVCLERSPDMVAGLLGVWKAGAAYVPLDPAYPPERLAFMVRDAGLRLLLTEWKCRHLFADAAVATVCLDTDWPMIAPESAANPSAAAGPANLAYVMYTSGSTGQPKGVMILHGGLVNYLRWAIGAYGFAPGGSVPVHSSISFDLTVTSLYPALLVGGQIELLEEDAGAQNLLAALRRGGKHNVVKITPAHLELLSQQMSPAELAAASDIFVIGGENLLAESLRPWRRHAPETRLINEYGPTETVVGCCIHEVQAADPDGGAVPIGRPIANVRLYVLDADLQPVPPGVVGELYIGGAGVARGYLNRPQLTAERFLADPFAGEAGARLYKSGDQARCRPDGSLEYLGRIDSQVKVCGYRIEPGEVEASLAAHPCVQSCVVAAREDEPGDRRLVAYVVPCQGPAPSAGALRDFLKQRLPDYMVPTHFVLLAALPLTRNGKIDRSALPAPSCADRSPDDQSAPPLTEAELTLVGIWRDVLKPERIGIHDDIFDLGARSLQVVRAVARIRAAFGIELHLRHVFDQPTVAGMARVVDELAWLAKAKAKTPFAAADAAEREEIAL